MSDNCKGRRVVITGLGAITPLGHSIDELWSGIKEGRSGIGRTTQIDASEFASQVSGEVKDFKPTDFMDKKEARNMARFTQFAVAGTVQAMKDAGLGPNGEGGYDPDRMGIYLGNGIGGFDIAEEAIRKLIDRGPRGIPPMTIPKMIGNEAAGNIAIKFGITGPCNIIVTACASGTDAIGAGYQAVKYGILDAVVTGGTEAAITPLAVGGFCRIQALSTEYNDRPQEACRPFDKDRDGFILGEGAGILIMEDLEHAKARGAHIWGELAGYGQSCDAFHVTAPNPEGKGAAKAMTTALKDAGMQPEDIDYINAHGTSTPANDPMETKAIKLAFGEHAYKLKVSSTKSMTSHLVGAAGAVELIISLLAIRDQFFPCTTNFGEADPECDLDYVPNKGYPGRIRAALSESLGFGGHNGALIVKEYKD
ncbi:MAG: beta-ketoacyl-ACP synthase II [Spirochaetales bacterium]|nr:beta-ketoacyl-ACP synthase II [Spirochaetales bacterium]